MTKLLKLILITAVISLNIQSGVQQCFAGEDNYDLNLKAFPNTFDYLKKTAVAPLDFNSSDWNKFGLIMLGAGICYTQDTKVRNFFQDNRTPELDGVSRFFMNFGEGEFTIPIAAVLYIYGDYHDDVKYKRAALLGVESMVVAAILTAGIKITLSRPLPNSALPYNTWYSSWDYSFEDLAFPSGHTSSAFAFATIISTEFSDDPAIPIISYTIASITALSMVEQDQHWASDILPGAALGYYTAKKIESLQPRKSSQGRREASNFIFFPMVSGDGVSLLCFYSF